MRVDRERMARVAREGFTNAADVADVLAADHGMDYRTAHKVVGLAVRRLVEQGAGELTASAVADAARDLTGAAVDVDPAQLDPAACAQARPQIGSSSSVAMDAMLAEVDALSAADRAWSSSVLGSAEAAERLLLERAAALSAS
jgi:argininosuccinate lyase